MEINDQSQITELALEKEEEELDFQKCVLFKKPSDEQAVLRIVQVENNFLNYRQVEPIVSEMPVGSWNPD